MSGLGLRPPAPAMACWDDLFPTIDPADDGTGQAIAQDWYFAGQPPAPLQVPYSWIASPFTTRRDPPFNRAAVAQAGGATAYASGAPADIAARGEWPFEATLDTACDGDPAALAQWTVDYYATPRTRFPEIRFLLAVRTDVEQIRLLRAGIGDRITITDPPDWWPTTDQIIEGREPSIENGVRYLTWSTSPVIGAAIDQAGPWFRWDWSTWDSPTDVIPF